MEGIITKVAAGSLAEELELTTGDKILQINGHTPLDIIDLSFQLAEEEIELLIEHADGERELIEFEKDIDEELGAEFALAFGFLESSSMCAFNLFILTGLSSFAVCMCAPVKPI